MKQHTLACPCGSGHAYSRCCAPLHQGQDAATAETLMRSRYCAYALELEPYLLASWHPDTRPPQLDLKKEAGTKWIGLEIKDHTMTGPDSATVEFVARYRIGGRAHRLHEVSRFVQECGRWVYVDGQFPQEDGA